MEGTFSKKTTGIGREGSGRGVWGPRFSPDSVTEELGALGLVFSGILWGLPWVQIGPSTNQKTFK